MIRSLIVRFRPINTERYLALAPLCESEIEKLFWKVAFPSLSRMGKFTPQVSVGRYRLDFALVGPKFQIAIECDGRQWHSTEEQIIHDDKRDLDLQCNGWRVVRFRGTVIWNDTPGCVAGIERLVKSLS